MLNKIFSNFFVKVFSYNGIVVIGRLLASFTVSKVSAIFLGPSGYALVGNLKNAFQGILGVTSTGFQSGVIKYVAENKSNKQVLKTVLSTVTFLAVILSLIVSVFLFLLSENLSVYLFKDKLFSHVFKWLAFLLPVISLNFLTVYIINGLERFKLYTIILTLANVVNALISFVLIYYYKLNGAFYASIFVPVFSFFGSLLFKDVRRIYYEAFNWKKHVSVLFIKSISAYLFMAIYSSALMSISYLLIRNNIIQVLNVFDAGLWEAMNKISMFYMVFFTSLFTLYLLPKLALNKTLRGYNKIMKTYFKYLIPFIITLFIILYAFREFVIEFILTDKFKTLKLFFSYQFVGDFIKVMAFSLAYQFHAKKMLIYYFVSDFILYTSYYLISVYLIPSYSLYGVFYAYVISVILYFLAVLISVYRGNNKFLKKHA